MSLQIYDYYFNGARNTGEKFEKQHIFKLLPLQGALLIAIIPWARSFCPFMACDPMNEVCMLMNEACIPMNEAFFQGTKKVVES